MRGDRVPESERTGCNWEQELEYNALVQLLDLLQTLIVQLAVVLVLLRLLSVLRLLLLLAVRTYEDAAGGAFCRAGLSELLLGVNEDVWYLGLFAEEGEVGNNVDGRNVAGEHEQTCER